jgi:sigma-B regulation protein RsbU (phosphoserine phosphatase)
MKLPKIFQRKRSIARRLTWRVILTVTLVFVTISTFIFGIVWIFGSAVLLAYTTKGMDVANEKISNVFTNIEVAVNNNKAVVEENIGNGSKLYDAQKKLLNLNPNIIGAAVAYNPNSSRMKGRKSAAFAYRDDRDSTSIFTQQLNNKKYDYLNQEWFTKPCEEGKGTWSEPYQDKVGSNVPMITYSLPLVDKKGEVYAIMTADVGIGWIKDLVTQTDDLFWEIINKNGEVTSFLATAEGTFVAHTDSTLILNENIEDYFKKQTADSERILNTKDEEFNSRIRLYTDHEDNMQIVIFKHLKSNGWVMGAVIPLRVIMGPVNDFIIGFVVIMVIGLLIVGLVCRATIRRITKPLRIFADSADEIAKGNFIAELPKIKTKDEMFRLRNSFETMQLSLVRQIEETKAINAEKGRMEGELQTARRIQMSMLPKTFPPYPDRDDIDIYGQLMPAKEVGGDLFDFYIRDEKLFFCIGDVSGKGVPASLLMAVTRSLFRTVSAHESQPTRIMTTINESISEDNDSNMFITLFIGVLDLPTGRLRYSNAGHNAPLLIGKMNTGKLPCDPNLPIGVEYSWKFTAQEAVIDPETVIFLFTDGLTEAENIYYDQFQEERVIETIRLSEHKPQQLIQSMTEAVHQFTDHAEQNDDQTMLAIQYTKEQDNNGRLCRTITLSNNIDEVPQLATFVDEICEAIGIDMSTAMSLNLAMEEAVVNVMDYAYPVGTKGNINIEAKANDQRLKFVITDWGTPFDPTAKTEVDTSLSAEERPIGGLGIHLVRQIMDSINYERTDGKNVLTLRKKLV